MAARMSAKVGAVGSCFWTQTVYGTPEPFGCLHLVREAIVLQPGGLTFLCWV